MATAGQRRFSGGELDPALHAGTDLTKYATGAATIRNMYVQKQGGVVSRPGTEFVGELYDSAEQSILVPFRFKLNGTTYSYMLEFGDEYVRYISDGAYVTDTAQNITSITAANPMQIVYSGSDTYTAGDEFYVSGVVGAIGAFVNGRNFVVTSVNTGTNTINVEYLDGTAVNSTSWGAYTSGGTIAEIAQDSTPWQDTELVNLNFAQEGNSLVITHPSYEPRVLTMVGTPSAVTITSYNAGLGRLMPRPAKAATPLAGTGTGATVRFVVTAVNAETGEESLGSYGTSTFTISAITKANPAAVTTSSPHGLSNLQRVLITGCTAMPEVNNREFTATVTGGSTFTLNGIDSSNYSAVGADGSVVAVSLAGTLNAPTSNPVTITWLAAVGASEYNIYYEFEGTYGYIATTRELSFVYDGTPAPDYDAPPPFLINPFYSSSLYPATVANAQQRQVFARDRQVNLSRIGKYTSFEISTPLQDDDAVSFQLLGKETNEINHIVELSRMVLFADTSEVVLEGNEAGIVTPDAINRKQHSYNGAARYPAPIPIDNTALYVQTGGEVVRDLAFDAASDGYKGNDLTTFSTHLFEGYTIVSWAFQKTPTPLVWVVRSDGALLSLTYIRDHQIWAWTRHDTEGLYKWVAPLQESATPNIYFIVERTFGSSTRRYVERATSRRITPTSDIRDFVALDCSLTTDGTNTGATTMTLSGGSTWANDEALTLTASVAATFVAGDVGNEIHLYIRDSVTDKILDTVRCTITAFTNGTVVTVVPHKTVPLPLRSTATTEWGEAVDELSGLWHLEGKDVAVFADGFVVANPLNENYAVLTVTNGAITLDQPRVKICVGLPYICDLETLDIDTPEGASLTNKQKLITEVTLQVHNSRGMWVGAKAPRGKGNREFYTGTTTYISGITNANPGVVTHSAGDIYTDGMVVRLASISGAISTYLNDRLFSVTRLTATTFSLQRLNGENVDTTSLGAYSSGGTITREDSPLQGLNELQLRDEESYDEPTRLASGKVKVKIDGEWNANGRVLIRQIDPVPMTIEGVFPSGYLATQKEEG